MYLYSLFNAIWSPYNHSCIVNDDLEIDDLLRLKIVYTVCNSVTKDFGFWEIQNESCSFINIIKITIFDGFVVGYVLGFEWNELVNNCFVNLHNGDVYQCICAN